MIMIGRSMILLNFICKTELTRSQNDADGLSAAIVPEKLKLRFIEEGAFGYAIEMIAGEELE